VDHHQQPYQALLAKERAQALGHAIAKLSVRQLMLIRYRYRHDLTFAEIGELFEVSPVAAHRMHTRVIGKLRVALEGKL
jgi:RNA polymerase sigma factor (sigma-70 family)